MFRAIAAGLIIVASALIAPRPAHAIVVTLDDNDLTVVRPLTGTTQVDFTGHITVTDGYELSVASLSPVFNASGDALALAICHCWRAPMIARMAAAEALAAEQQRKYKAKLKAAR